MSDLTRRGFLHGAAAVAATGIPLAQEPKKKVGWAILGLGGYATGQILPRFKDCELSRPTALISGSPDKAKRIAAQYGIPESKIYNYQNLEKIKDDPDIDVVYVITPPGTHHEFTLRALKSGKHVCCEKPMASSSKECEEMVAEAKRQGKLLQIGYRCHYENLNLKAMEICRSGGIGQVRTIVTEHAFTMTWDGGWHSDPKLGAFGAISEIGIYSIQAACYLAGGDPVEVMALRNKIDAPRFKGVEDVNQAVLSFPNGALANIATGYSWNANNYRVYGTTGRIDAEPATGYGGNRFRLNGQTMEAPANVMWAEQMDDLSRAIQTKGTVRTPGEMGLRDIRIIEAIIRSGKERKAVSL
jgi:predicted dehydrogenase